MYLVYDYVVGREVEEMDSRFSVLGFWRSLSGRSFLTDPGEGFCRFVVQWRIDGQGDR